MKESYEFVAIFNYEKDGISISFPDLPGVFSSAETTEEAIKNANEVLGLFYMIWKWITRRFQKLHHWKK